MEGSTFKITTKASKILRKNWSPPPRIHATILIQMIGVGAEKQAEIRHEKDDEDENNVDMEQETCVESNGNGFRLSSQKLKRKICPSLPANAPAVKRLRYRVSAIECEESVSKTTSPSHVIGMEEANMGACGIPQMSRQCSSSNDAVFEQMLADVTEKFQTLSLIEVWTKDELKRILVSRDMLYHWCNLPFFDKVVQNCFVRVETGRGKGSYRLAEVVGVEETPKIYLFGKTTTKKTLRLKYGSSESVVKLMKVSNQEFTDEEFDKLMETLSANDVPFNTAKVDQTAANLKCAEKYAAVLAQQNDDPMKGKSSFVKNPHGHVTRAFLLATLKSEAVLAGDKELVYLIDQDLASL